MQVSQKHQPERLLSMQEQNPLQSGCGECSAPWWPLCFEYAPFFACFSLPECFLCAWPYPFIACFGAPATSAQAVLRNVGKVR